MDKKYANQIGYSDTSPYEIVKVISDKTLEIRGMAAVRANGMEEMGFVAGGYCGHFANQENQRWEITSDPERAVFRIRKNKRGQWKDAGGARYMLADAPEKFYDYNF